MEKTNVSIIKLNRKEKTQVASSINKTSAGFDKKAANRKYRKQNLIRYYRITAGYKVGGCVICGYDKCEKALCFHHIDQHGKKKAVAKLHNSSIETLIQEIEKCVVVCANCHAEIHSRLKRTNNAKPNNQITSS